MATPRMFRALGIPLKRGRLLADSDVAGASLVAVINETAARLYWSGDDPIGKTIRYYPQETSPSIQIVGVVGDVRRRAHARRPRPSFYVPFAQAPRPPYEGRSMTFILRGAREPAAVAGEFRSGRGRVHRCGAAAGECPVDGRGRCRYRGSAALHRYCHDLLCKCGVLPWRRSVFTGSLRTAFSSGFARLGCAWRLARTTRHLQVDRRQRHGLALLGVIVGVPAALAGHEDDGQRADRRHEHGSS